MFLINPIIQSSVRHLIIQRCLYDEKEMSTLAHQFPHVKYLNLCLPSDKSSFINCLKTVFNRDDNCYWPELINFSAELVYEQEDIISNESQLSDLFIRSTNLKYRIYSFDDFFLPTLTIWY
jgi:hypothetical protein